jgi:hypothetical protein
MKKLEEIKNEIWRIWEILVLAKECFHYSYYLHRPDTQKELDYINKSADLDFIRHILWRTTVIELSKLLSGSDKRDRFNINHFIGKLSNDGHFGDLGITKVTLDKWKNEIERKKETIDILLKYRDKVYAHSDPNKDEYSKLDITFKQTEELIDFVENIIKEIYGTILNSAIDTETIIFRRQRFDLVKILADEQERKIQEMLSYLKR